MNQAPRLISGMINYAYTQISSLNAEKRTLEAQMQRVDAMIAEHSESADELKQTLAAIGSPEGIPAS